MNRLNFKSRWADVDANGHLRHSAYADFCAHARVEILEEMGLSVAKMRQLGVGPILFREELTYKREIGLGEEVGIETYLLKARKDASRWAIKHLMFKTSGELACEVIVEGAWMNLRERKLGALPDEYGHKMNEMPKADDFSWLD